VLCPICSLVDHYHKSPTIFPTFTRQLYSCLRETSPGGPIITYIHDIRTTVGGSFRDTIEQGRETSAESLSLSRLETCNNSIIYYGRTPTRRSERNPQYHSVKQFYAKNSYFLHSQIHALLSGSPHQHHLSISQNQLLPPKLL